MQAFIELFLSMSPLKAYAQNGQMDAVGTIVDNDYYELEITDESSGEGDDSYIEPNELSFTVSMQPELRVGHVVTVDYEIREFDEDSDLEPSERASTPDDFKVLPCGDDVNPMTDDGSLTGTLIFGGSQSTGATIEVAINGDRSFEKDEKFEVVLSNPRLVKDIEPDTDSYEYEYEYESPESTCSASPPEFVDAAFGAAQAFGVLFKPMNRNLE